VGVWSLLLFGTGPPRVSVLACAARPYKSHVSPSTYITSLKTVLQSQKPRLGNRGFNGGGETVLPFQSLRRTAPSLIDLAFARNIRWNRHDGAASAPRCLLAREAHRAILVTQKTDFTR
jgi:hypothetical protein